MPRIIRAEFLSYDNPRCNSDKLSNVFVPEDDDGNFSCVAERGTRGTSLVRDVLCSEASRDFAISKLKNKSERCRAFLPRRKRFLGKIKIDALKSGALRMTATDLDISVVIEQEVDILESGSICVSGKKLGEITVGLPNEPVHLKLDAKSEKVEFHAGRFKSKLSGTGSEQSGNRLSFCFLLAVIISPENFGCGYKTRRTSAILLLLLSSMIFSSEYLIRTSLATISLSAVSTSRRLCESFS